MENIENIITENFEDVTTAIPEVVAPVVNPNNGLKVAGGFGLGVFVGIVAYEAGKRIVAKTKAKKEAKVKANEEVEVVAYQDDFVDANENNN